MEERNSLVRRSREAGINLSVNLSAVEQEDNILLGGFGSKIDYLR
jgi:hypothetical protein